MADAEVTIGQFVAISPKLAQALNEGQMETVNRCALAVTKAARRSVQLHVGNDQRLSGMPNGREKIQPYYRAARSVTDPIAVIQCHGPWWLLEEPRRGGYKIRPREAKALTTPQGPHGGATGGAVTSPAAPIRRTMLRAPEIIAALAPEAMDDAVKRAIVRVGRG